MISKWVKANNFLFLQIRFKNIRTILLILVLCVTIIYNSIVNLNVKYPIKLIFGIMIHKKISNSINGASLQPSLKMQIPILTILKGTFNVLLSYHVFLYLYIIENKRHVLFVWCVPVFIHLKWFEFEVILKITFRFFIVKIIVSIYLLSFVFMDVIILVFTGSIMSYVLETFFQLNLNIFLSVAHT